MKTKNTIPVEVESGVSGVRLISYRMSATIRTGDFQNVIPEIVVEGGTIEEARFVLTQEIDFIKEKYAPQPKRVAPVTPVVQAPVTPVVQTANALHGEGLIKALNFIKSCKSVETLAVIQGKVEASTKLSSLEKGIARGEIVIQNAKLLNSHV